MGWSYSVGDYGSTVLVFERDGGRLHVDFKGEDGNRVRKSLGHSDRERAVKEAAKIHERLVRGKAGIPELVDDRLLHETPVRRETVPADGADESTPFGAWRRISGPVRFPDWFFPDERNSSSTVYFIQAETTLQVKIGVTKNVKGRVKRLSTMLAQDIRLVAWIGGVEEVFEKRLHAYFFDARDHGEWFRLTLVLLKYIDRLKVDNPYMADRTKPVLLPQK